MVKAKETLQVIKIKEIKEIQTGKEIKIAAKKVVKFKVGKKLADKVAAK